MKAADLINTPRAIVAALTVAACGAMFYNMLPLYLGLTQDERALDTAATGLVSGAFFLGYNIATISAFFWIRRFDWRRIASLTAPVAAAALFAGTLIDSYGLLLVVTIISGAAFAALYGIGTTAIGDTRNPSRWYGVKIAVEAGLGAVLFLVLPGTLVAAYGLQGLVSGMILAMLVLVPLALGLPRHGSKAKGGEFDLPQVEPSTKSVSAGRVWGALFATLFFFAGQTTIWAFIERLGNAGGFPAETVGNLLSLTLLFAVAGSLTCAGIGFRFGNVKPFAAACVIYLVSLMLLTQSTQLSYYAMGACVVTYSFGMGLPYIVARVAELDADGRYVVLSVPAIGIGAMVGPSLAGALASETTLLPILGFGATIVGVAMLLAVVTGRTPANT